MKNLTMLNKLCGALLASVLLLPSLAVNAAEYQIDTKGAHAFIQFKVKHLGFSWLYGRFDTFDGTFSYDENKPGDSKVQVTIDTKSVNSNHAERDKHLRSDDFLHASKYPTAEFVSTKVIPGENGTAQVVGNLTLHGTTKELVLDVHKVGMGKDPWGGFRAGFEGTTRFAMKDFGFEKDMGMVEMILSIEGIRK